MTEVIIPFKEQFRDAMLSGTKTATSRTKRYGWPNDTFEAFGQTFVITDVYRLPVFRVAHYLHKEEGFENKGDFWQTLREILPRLSEGAKVYVHRFKIKGEETE